MHREQRIEQIGELDPVRLGDQPEEGAVSVEIPGSTGRHDLEQRLLIAIDELIADLSGGILVDQLDDVGTIRAAR